MSFSCSCFVFLCPLTPLVASPACTFISTNKRVNTMRVLFVPNPSWRPLSSAKLWHVSCFQTTSLCFKGPPLIHIAPLPSRRIGQTEPFLLVTRKPVLSDLTLQPSARTRRHARQTIAINSPTSERGAVEQLINDMHLLLVPWQRR